MSEPHFVRDLVQESLPIWEQCLNSEFLTKLENGTLDEECFKGYIIEDTLYLREYAKVFAWGMTKADTMETIRTYYSLLSFVNEGEGATRLKYLKRYGLTDAQVERLPLRPQNQAYTNCMLRAAQEGDGEAECIMACLPCMLSYAWIFQQLLKRSPGVKDTPYWELVRDYADKSYEDACHEWAAYAEKACADLSEERIAHCKQIFRDCSEHELHFWEMAAAPRNDI